MGEVTLENVPSSPPRHHKTTPYCAPGEVITVHFSLLAEYRALQTSRYRTGWACPPVQEELSYKNKSVHKSMDSCCCSVIISLQSSNAHFYYTLCTVHQILNAKFHTQHLKNPCEKPTNEHIIFLSIFLADTHIGLIQAC